MSYGYQPKFEDRALAGFQSLPFWLQEEVLDEIDRLLYAVPAPDVAQRLHPRESVHEMTRTIDGVEYLVFLLTILEVASRELQILRVGHLPRG